DNVNLLAQRAGEIPYVEKLAADAETNHEAIYQMAAFMRMPVVDFVKTAYADPEQFTAFLGALHGIKLTPQMLKKAMTKRAGLLSGLSTAINYMKGKAGDLYKGVKGLPEAYNTAANTGKGISGGIDSLLQRLLGNDSYVV